MDYRDNRPPTRKGGPYCTPIWGPGSTPIYIDERKPLWRNREVRCDDIAFSGVQGEQQLLPRRRNKHNVDCEMSPLVLVVDPLFESAANLGCSAELASAINEKDRLAVRNKNSDDAALDEPIKIIN